VSGVRFQRLFIRGFKSYSTETVWEISLRRDGFFLVSGENGAGKSSLAGALLWVLFGKTERGSKASTIVNRSGQFLTSVAVDLVVGDRDCRLTRTQNPNSLTLAESEGWADARVVTQDEVDALLGISYEGALLTFVFGQFNAFFFDLSPTEKLALLSQFLELDPWIEASDRAKAAARGLSVQVEAARRQLSAGEARVELLGSAIEDTKTRAAAYEGERKTREDRWLAAREAAEDKVELLVDELERSASEVARLEGEIAKARDELLREDELLKRARERVGGLHVARANAEDALKALKKRRGDVARLEGDCPTCLREVTADHLERSLAKLDGELRGLADRADAARRVEVEAIEARDEIEKRLRAVDARFTRAQNHLNTATADRNAASHDKARALAQFEEAKRRLAEVDLEANPYADQLKTQKGELDNESRAAAVRAEEVEQLGNHQALAEFWIKGFRDIRLWVVEQALSELELHVNNAISELGLRGHSIRFDIERPKADGSGVIRGFSVLVYAPGHPDPVSWESWSGGETQRLRIAGAIGLSDLVCARRGFHPSVEFWDEPTAHLNSAGVDDLVELLGVRARQRRRQVYLIDHRAIDAGDFDGEIRVRKSSLGSQLAYNFNVTSPDHKEGYAAQAR